MAGRTARQQGRNAGRQVKNSRALEIGVRVGLVSYGLVHLLIAWIALQVAWTHENRKANSSGALRQLASNALGGLLLWVVAFGLIALVIWQLSEAAWGHTAEEGGKRTAKRLASVGRAVIYGALAYTAFGIVTGSKSGSSTDSLTAQVMKQTGGRFLVGLIGVGIVGLGVALVVRGVKASFTNHLQPEATSGRSGHVIVRLGQAGYAAKGVSLVVVGGLFGWAAWTYDPHKAGGLDVALQTLLDQAFGAWLLTLVALGFAAFAVYCFAWARYPRE